MAKKKAKTDEPGADGRGRHHELLATLAEMADESKRLTDLVVKHDAVIPQIMRSKLHVVADRMATVLTKARTGIEATVAKAE